MRTRFDIPIRTYSETNTRGHWAPKAKRTKSQRGAAKVEARSAFVAADEHYPATHPGETLRGRGVLSEPVRITLTRIAPRKLDSGNLEAAFKAVQDGIADALGIDDGDDRLTWVYQQARGAPKEHAVRVTIETGKEA